MGWGNGISMSGRDIGYNIKAKCEEFGCAKDIDRGLAYACGDNHEAGEDYCEGYFCYDHLMITPKGQRCPTCAIKIDEEVKY